MRQRIYIDTSVVGGCCDAEFEAHTTPLFERIHNGEFVVLLSSITQDELENAPSRVQAWVRGMKNEYTEFLEVSSEAIELANEYIYVHRGISKIMKTTTKTKEPFDAVRFMRQQRGRLSDRLSKMTTMEIIAYFRKKAELTTLKPRP